MTTPAETQGTHTMTEQQAKTEKKPVCHVHVKTIDTDEIVHSVPIFSLPSERNQEKIVMEMMWNMDLSRFYVDDSEIDELAHKEERIAGEVATER